MSKEGWISVARAQAALGQPQPCQICFFSFELSHAHHLMPLAEQYDRGFDKPNHTHAWLCPNHHALIHFFAEKRSAGKPRKRASLHAYPVATHKR